MTDFLADLYNYTIESTPRIRGNPEYEQAVQAYMEIEQKVKEKIGGELLYEYQCAEANVSYHRDLAVFAQTLRLGCRFLLEVLG